MAKGRKFTLGGSLSMRITLLLMGGFVLLQLAILAATPAPDSGSTRAYNLPRPEQLAAMVAAYEASPPALRPALIDSFDGSVFSVSVTRVFPPPIARPNASILALGREYAAALPGRHVGLSGELPVLQRVIGDSFRATRLTRGPAVAVQLRTGEVLLIDGRASDVLRQYLRRRSVLGMIGGLLVIVVLLIAVRQTTRPLMRLSRSVRGFAEDLDARDLPVGGPGEVRALAEALNDMKHRIRALVADKTRILAAIAHDMRTYLTRLRLRAEFIDDDGQRARAVRDIDEMHALLEDTLLLSRSRAEQPGPPPRLDLGEQLARMVEIRREMGDAVSLDIEGTVPFARASATGYRRLIDNLVTNGLRYGTAVRIALRAEPDGIVTTVTDDGPGIPEAHMAQLGEPFLRIDPSRSRESGGAGLGLAIVRALADRDGARVTYANAPEGGLRVRLVHRRAGESDTETHGA